MANTELLTQPTELDVEVVSKTIGDIQNFLASQDTNDASTRRFREAAGFIDGIYDEYVPDHKPELVFSKILGAAALVLVEDRYGRDEHSPKLYSGSHEHDVLATYHHAQHPRGFITDAFRYAQAVNRNAREPVYGPEEYARLPIIGSCHDLIMGNERGNDERQSALLASRVMRNIGMSFTEDEPTYTAIKATTWNNDLKKQSVDEEKGFIHYQRAAGVADLMHLFDKRGPYQGLCCIVEDFSKNMHQNILNTEAARLGVSLEGIGVDQCMDMIDNSRILSDLFAASMCSQVEFFANFNPADPNLDRLFPGRADNVRFLEKLRDDYLAGRINARRSLELAREFMS